MPPRRAGYLRRVCLKTVVTGVHFAHFGLDSGMVFEGLTGVYEMNEKKRETCEFEMDLKNFLFEI